MVYIEQQKNRNNILFITLKLFLILFCCSFNIYASQVTLQRIELLRVEYYQKKIATDLKKNSLLRAAIVTGLLSTLAYTGYKIYTTAPQEVASVNNSVNVTELSQNINEYIQTQLKNNPQAVAKLSFFQKVKSWFKDAFVMMVNQAGALCILDLMRGIANPVTKYIYLIDTTFEKGINSIFYKRTLSWFVQKHTQIFSFLDEIEKKCSLPENGSNDTQLSLDSEEITKNWEIIAEQLCSAIAFMNIMVEKKAHSSSLLSIREKAIVEKIMHMINTTAQSIEQSLNSSDKSMIAGKIKLFKLLLQQEFDSFNQVESAQLYQ